MSVEFRQRSAAEIIQIVNRRKWHIVLPAIAVSLAVAWVVVDLPKVYESTTLLTVTAPTISEKVVPSLTDENLSQRLQAIGQNVMSRTSLEPLITQHNLYEGAREAGVPMEDIVVQMREQIKIETEKVGEDQSDRVVGLRLTYRDSTPEIVQAITRELGNKYIAAQNIESNQSAETTREFIDKRLAEAKSGLDALEQERIIVINQNIQTLPESGEGLIAQLEGLRNREATISKDKETLMTEKGRVQESIRSINSQSRLLVDFSEKETQEAIVQASRIEDTPAYGQLIQKRAEFNSKLENLKTQYRDKHPEIIQTQTDINKIDEELDKLAKSTDKRVKQANQSGARKAELQRKSLEIEKQKAESQIGQIDKQLLTKDMELSSNSGLIAGLEAKINAIPGVRVALDGINNRYLTAKTSYDELLKKYNAAQAQVDRETNLQGETIRVVDPANLPQTPVNASKKPFFMVVGLGIGLAIGMMLAAFFEVPRLLKIQNIEDAKYYTGLPILASVPKLLTEGEILREKRLYLGKVFAGIIVSIVSIPVLIVALQITHIFERMS
ncbi:MAG: hypothetical protein H7070_03555 [Saprospiraceae bacterium]|nr:hypothetical protein [Pyrinomonadaceae bacterium]